MYSAFGDRSQPVQTVVHIDEAGVQGGETQPEADWRPEVGDHARGLEGLAELPRLEVMEGHMRPAGDGARWGRDGKADRREPGIGVVNRVRGGPLDLGPDAVDSRRGGDGGPLEGGVEPEHARSTDEEALDPLDRLV